MNHMGSTPIKLLTSSKTTIETFLDQWISDHLFIIKQPKRVLKSMTKLTLNKLAIIIILKHIIIHLNFSLTLKLNKCEKYTVISNH